MSGSPSKEVDALQRKVSVVAGLAGAVLITGFAATAASAATGEVTVFETETTRLTTYADPSGCHKLPLAAHVLNNHTDRPVRIYGDPFCAGPSVTVQPGFGSHVAPGSGSFSV